ncbi:P1 family peptidase [Inquilinus limosus]|uniref:P1 family peptidase n=1 Tax=Inquilinus limosus TaxID=171674 RepID=UPI003F14D0E3
MARARLRDLGLSIGTLPPGPKNGITDVPGVLVGQVTLVGETPHIIRTGITAIVPQEGEIWHRNLFAAGHVLNGNSEVTGLTWINEFGLLCGPLALTGTFSIGAVHEGMVDAEMTLATGADFKMPLVAETYDGWLSESEHFVLRPQHTLEALRRATAGPVAEGNAGGGTGTNAHEFKAGTGTASRRVAHGGETWTVGILVQTNYGDRERLLLDGVPVGREIPVGDVPSCFAERRVEGSILVVIATDAPLFPHQLRRLAQRAGLGLARVGGLGWPGSGDVFIAFSTGNDLGQATDTSRTRPLESLRMLPDFALQPLMAAVVEATEEAIWNSLCAAETMTGRKGRVSHALPVERLPDIMRRYGRT